MDLSKVGVSWSSDQTIKQGMELFGNQVPDGCQHRNTTVRNLSLTETLDFLYGKALSEPERIEISQRRNSTGKTLAGVADAAP